MPHRSHIPPRSRSNRHWPLTLCSVLAVVGAITARAGTAEAKPKLSFDGDLLFPTAPSQAETGVGGGLRLGYELDAVILSLTPEIGGSYSVMGGDVSPGVVRGFGGARLMFGALVRPGVYGHLGFAHVAYTTRGGLPEPPTRGAPTYDGGFALDLTFIPKIDLGVHVGYVGVASGAGAGPNGWVNAGAHVAIVF